MRKSSVDTSLKPCKSKKVQKLVTALVTMLSVLARIVYQLTGLARAESLVVKPYTVTIQGCLMPYDPYDL